MKTLLTTLKNNKLGVMICIVIAVVVGLIRLWISGSGLRVIFITLCDNILAGVLISGVVMFIIKDYIDRKAMETAVEIVSPNRIKGLLKTLAENAYSYKYYGSTGSEFRKSALKLLKSQCQTKKHQIKVDVFLLDPTNDRLIETYTECKYPEKTRTTNDVKIKILATLLRCYLAKNNNFNINIFFRSTFTSYRVDMADNYVLITSEGQEDVAMKALKDSHYYTMFKRELDWMQHVLVPVEFACNKPDLVKVDKKNLPEIFESMGFFQKEFLDSIAWNDLLKEYHNERSSY